MFLVQDLIFSEDRVFVNLFEFEHPVQTCLGRLSAPLGRVRVRAQGGGMQWGQFIAPFSRLREKGRG